MDFRLHHQVRNSTASRALAAAAAICIALMSCGMESEKAIEESQMALQPAEGGVGGGGGGGMSERCFRRCFRQCLTFCERQPTEGGGIWIDPQCKWGCSETCREGCQP